MPLVSAAQAINPLLDRLTEEAGVFASNARNVIGRETLQQRAAQARKRFRPRVGQAARQAPPLVYQDREIVSEYGYARFNDGGNWHEVRQVIAVDGRQVTTAAKARRTLTMGITSDDDRHRKKLLSDFEKHGLIGTATDFALMILLFRRSELANFTFIEERLDNVGAEHARVIAYRQNRGDSAMLVFEGNRALKQRLEGKLWLRASDGLPLRIDTSSRFEDNGVEVRDEGRVEYIRDASGYLLPASAVHRRFVGNELAAENRFAYSDFQRFSADAEIKFTEVPDPPK